MIHRVPLPRSQPPANSSDAFLALYGIFLLGSGLLALAARGLGGLHSLPHSLPVERKGGPLSDPPFRTALVRALASLMRTLDASTLSLVLDVYLLAPYVLLDDLRVLHNVLADAHLFLGHGALADDDLFLGDGHHDLVLADLGLRSLAGDRHPLHAYFLVAGGDLYLLAVGPHALSDLELSGFALSGTGGEFLLAPLHPELVLVCGARGGVLVGLVGARLVGGLGALQAVVRVDLALELRRDLPVIVEGRTVLGRLLVGCDGDSPTLVVGGAYRFPGDEGAPRPEEAHLHAEVLRLVALVEKQVVYLTDLRPALVHHGVTSVLVFDRREPVAALFHVFSFS